MSGFATTQELEMDGTALQVVIFWRRKSLGLSLAAFMGTPLRQLGPSEAFHDSERRSFGAGAAGFLVFGCLQTALPTIYRESLFIASGMLAAFLTTLTLTLAHYHRRWKLGVGGAILFSILPFFVNVLWARFSDRSLIYPMIALGFLGILILATIHRKISGPRWDGDIEDEVLKELIADVDSNVTWKDRITWLCFAGAATLLLILLFR
jgi:hypothetical protein